MLPVLINMLPDAPSRVHGVQMDLDRPHNCLFPPYLNKGSRGPACRKLAELLEKGGFAADGLIADEDYGDRLEESVRNLQIGLGFDPDDPEESDGQFGTLTQRNWAEIEGGVDVRQILAEVGAPPTHWVGPDGTSGYWPERDERDPLVAGGADS